MNASSPKSTSSSSARAADRVADRIGREILSGRYKPGQPIREQELAGRFGCSRATVRQAFHIVEKDGLLENVAWKGARVARLTSDDVEDLLLLISALLGVVAELACERSTDDEIDELSRRVECLALTSNPSRPLRGQSKAAFGLDSYLVEIARGRQATTMIASVARLAYWQHHVLNEVDADWRADALKKWRTFSRALKTRNAERAKRAIGAVAAHARERMMQLHREQTGSVEGLFAGD